MKIFISHSSKDKNFGNSLVELLRSLGVKENEITFTSNTAYGIPIGQNIFKWLKSQITENPFVIYLLSEEYYRSVACLNEMGAAWIIENEHAAIFTPNFDLSSKEFQGGALDPREIGFYINDEERILAFIHHLSTKFEITKNPILISQNVKKFLEQIKNFKQDKVIQNQTFFNTESIILSNSLVEDNITTNTKQVEKNDASSTKN
ncbi:toll/interleukin-1 receptor domain-containing protein, partial [Chryseobacterium sp. MYb328]|uniref:toll/interleukin-1 receptor domain-containing protein n=1 Tax=Chryseobacterium sp. MYb328 TaxID=2745231 RepID=UPI0030B7122E